MEGVEFATASDARSVEHSGGDLVFHPNPSDFIKNNGEYGPIGKTMVGLSNMEFAHDQFILSLMEQLPEQALQLSKNFPRQYKEKVDFVVGAVCNIRALKAVPLFFDGGLNLQWLQYQLDELYGFRAILAHGSIFYSETHEHGARWRFDRIISPRRKHWCVASHTVGSTFLAVVFETAFALKYYFIHLKGAIEGTYCWEKSYKSELQIRSNRRFLKGLIESGVVQPDQNMQALFGTKNDE